MPAMMPAPGHSSSYMPSAASGRHFEQRAAGIEQPVHPVARQQLAAADVALAGLGRPAERGSGHLLAQLRDELQMLLAAGLPTSAVIGTARLG